MSDDTTDIRTETPEDVVSDGILRPTEAEQTAEYIESDTALEASGDGILRPTRDEQQPSFDEINQRLADLAEEDSGSQIPPVQASVEVIYPSQPDLNVEVPVPSAGTFLQFNEVAPSVRSFIPNGGNGGTTVLAQEAAQGETDGFFFFISGYPLFLPKELSEDLARFILNKNDE